MQNHEDAILESLLKSQKILPAEQIAHGVATMSHLSAQGVACSLSDILNREGYLSQEELTRLGKLENLIPGYTIWEKIGEGKFGIVYKAWQHTLERWVAIKVLNPALIHSQASVARFLREICALGKLDHPNIIRALDSGQIGDLYYVVTEYFEGSTLAQYVRAQGHLPEDEVLHMGKKLASALRAIWEKEMIHRDIVPENIMISKGEVKLYDLGLMRVISADSYLTPYPILRRSYPYISPEQMEGKTLDFRSDIYALGAVLYYALTGHPTVENWSCNDDELPHQKIVPISHYAHNISHATENLIMQMLRYEAKARAESKGAFEKAFTDIIQRRSSVHQSHATASMFVYFLEILSWVGLLLAGCYGIWQWFSPHLSMGHSGISQGLGSESRLAPEQLYTHYAPGVVLIKSKEMLGSGVFIVYDGHLLILTNAHVIQDARDAKITLKNGQHFQAQVFVTNPALDLAVVQPAPEFRPIVTIPLAKSEPKIGEDIFVIGHPKGYQWSLTRGTVSGIRDDTIQTDAAIHPGNSGGPLLDSTGQLVGVTTFVVGSNHPIGFAISVTRIEKFLKSVMLRYSSAYHDTSLIDHRHASSRQDAKRVK